MIAISSNTLKWMSIEIGLQVAKLGRHRIIIWNDIHTVMMIMMIIQRKCCIDITSVGLVHACPSNGKLDLPHDRIRLFVIRFEQRWPRVFAGKHAVICWMTNWCVIAQRGSCRGQPVPTDVVSMGVWSGLGTNWCDQC